MDPKKSNCPENSIEIEYFSGDEQSLADSVPDEDELLLDVTDNTSMRSALTLSEGEEEDNDQVDVDTEVASEVTDGDNGPSSTDANEESVSLFARICAPADSVEEELLNTVIEYSIATFKPLSQLSSLLQSYTADTSMPALPAESELMDSHIMPLYLATVDAIRQSVVGHKICVAFSRRTLLDSDSQQPVSFAFVMVGPLLKNKVGNLYLLEAVNLNEKGAAYSFDQLFRDSLEMLWPDESESHAKSVLLSVTDHPYDLLSDELLADRYPKLLQANGYVHILADMLHDMADQISALAVPDCCDTSGGPSSRDLYYLEEMTNLVEHACNEMLLGGQRPALEEAVDAIDSVLDNVLYWYSEQDGDPEREAAACEVYRRNLAHMPDFEALVDICNKLNPDRPIESTAWSPIKAECDKLTKRELAAFRYAPIGGADLKQSFPRFDALLGPEPDNQGPVAADPKQNGCSAIATEYIPLYSVVYCNAQLLATAGATTAPSKQKY